MSLGMRYSWSVATAGALFATALSSSGCFQKELLGGGGGSDTTSGGGVAGSGGVVMGGAGGAGTAGSGGFEMGGSGGVGPGGMGGASMGGSAGSGGFEMGGSGGVGPMPDGWARQFGDAADIQEANGVATDASGNVIVTGTLGGVTVMDGFTLSAGGGHDVFVAKLDPSGAVLWAKRFGNGLYQDGYDVAVDPSGNVVLAGGFYGTIDFGGGALTSAGAEDLFVVKLDPAGNHLWSKRFGDSAPQPQFPGCKVVTDAAGAVIVGGMYLGSIDFGGGPLPTGGPTQADVFLAKLDANGNHVYSRRFGDVEPMGQTGERLRGLAIDSAGNAVLSGIMDGSIDFGGGPLASAAGAFVAKIGPTGGHVWSKVFGQFGADMTALTLTPQDGVVLAGYFSQLVDYGGGQLDAANGHQVLVKLDSAGQLVWNKQYVGGFYALGAATSAQGATTFVGYTFGDMNLTGLGGGVLPSFQSSSSATLLTLAPDGSLLAAKNYSYPSALIGPDRELDSVVYDPSGYLVIAGTFDSGIDMGFGVLDAGTWADVLVARLPQSL